MSLQLPSEMELTGDGMSGTKAYRVSMLSTLAVGIYLMRTFCFFLPIPLELFALYFFRDFGEVVAKALYIKNVLTFVTIMVLGPDLILLLYMITLVISDVVMGAIAVQEGFIFDNRAVLRMSMAAQVPVQFAFLFTVMPVMMVEFSMPAFVATYFFIITLMAILPASAMGGLMTMFSFKAVVGWMEKMPNMIHVNKELMGF